MKRGNNIQRGNFGKTKSPVFYVNVWAKYQLKYADNFSNFPIIVSSSGIVFSYTPEGKHFL